MDQLLQGLFSNLGASQPAPPLPPALEMLRSIGDEQTFMRVSGFALVAFLLTSMVNMAQEYKAQLASCPSVRASTWKKVETKSSSSEAVAVPNNGAEIAAAAHKSQPGLNAPPANVSASPICCGLNSSS
jgi:hypothetical protein